MSDFRSRKYTFGIDVSGTPYNDVCFGMIAYDGNRLYALKKEFEKVFPRYVSKRQKASKLKSNELAKIINFLNDFDGVKMGATLFRKSDWDAYLSDYFGRAKIKEKLYALNYLMLLKSFVFPRYNYRLTLCNENYLDMTSVLDNLRRVLKSNRFHMEVSISSAKYNVEIKFADYVAGALRKIKPSILEGYSNYHTIKGRLSKRDLNKVFR